MASLPPLTVLDPAGRPVRLLDLVAKGPAVIALLRHFG